MVLEYILHSIFFIDGMNVVYSRATTTQTWLVRNAHHMVCILYRVYVLTVCPRPVHDVCIHIYAYVLPAAVQVCVYLHEFYKNKCNLFLF